VPLLRCNNWGGIYHSIVPFACIQGVGLVLVAILPQIALWLSGRTQQTFNALICGSELSNRALASPEVDMHNKRVIDIEAITM